MIKLDELKLNDEVYYICGFHWCERLKITKEKDIFPYMDGDKFVYYVEARSENKRLERLFAYNESSLFKTGCEVEKAMQIARLDRKGYLVKDYNLLEYLFEKAEGFLTDAEGELIKEIMEEIRK